MENERKIFEDNTYRLKDSPQRTIKNIIAILLIVGIVASGIIFANKKVKSKLNTIEDYIIAEVVQADIQKKILFNGEVKSNSKIYIKSKQMGRIEQLNIKVGDKITRGSLLATIDVSEYEEKIEELKLEATNKQLLIENEKHEKEMDEIEYNQSIEKLNKQILKEEVVLPVSKELLELGTLSESDYKSQQDNIESLKENIQVLRERYEVNEKIAENNIALIQNGLDKTQLDIRNLNKKMLYKEVYSNYEGIIKEVLINSGDTINKNTNLFVISTLNDYDYEIKVPQSNMNDIEVGQNTIITFSNGEEVKGAISKINDVIVTDTKEGYDYIIAQVNIEGESTYKLISGITFTAKVILEESKDALVIPRGEYINKSGSFYVYKVSEDGKKAEKVVITKGTYDEHNIEIKEGLALRDKIIISSYQDFKDLATVNLKKD